jgi:hypothetical protein
MPQRKNVRRIPSPGVQGDDSWIEVSRLTVGEARDADRFRTDGEGDSFHAVLELYQKHVVGWNWVDDDGEPLPLPGDDPGVVEALTDLEFSFVGDCLAGNEVEQKN